MRFANLDDAQKPKRELKKPWAITAGHCLEAILTGTVLSSWDSSDAATATIASLHASTNQFLFR